MHLRRILEYRWQPLYLSIICKANNWREELHAIACAAVEEPEPKKSSIGTHKEAIHEANNLMLYLSQYGEEETAKAMGKAVMSLQSAKKQLHLE